MKLGMAPLKKKGSPPARETTTQHRATPKKPSRAPISRSFKGEKAGDKTQGGAQGHRGTLSEGGGLLPRKQGDEKGGEQAHGLHPEDVADQPQDHSVIHTSAFPQKHVFQVV